MNFRELPLPLSLRWRALERLTGFLASEILGLKEPYPWWTTNTFKRMRKDRQKFMRQVVQQRKDIKHESVFQKKTGELIWVEVAPKAVFIEGEFRYQVNIWVDITERKRHQRAMEQYTSAVIRAHEEERRILASELHA